MNPKLLWVSFHALSERKMVNMQIAAYQHQLHHRISCEAKDRASRNQDGNGDLSSRERKHQKRPACTEYHRLENSTPCGE
jgi:hypothetical protein